MKILGLLLLLNLAHAADSPFFFFGKLDDGSRTDQTQETFAYIKTILPRFATDCLKRKCSTESDLALLKQIGDLARRPEENGVLFFSDGNGNLKSTHTEAQKRYLDSFGFPKGKRLFQTNDTTAPRAAISSVGPGPIVLNLDLVKSLIFSEAFKLMLHEYGHQTGLRDDEHRGLDGFALRVGAFLAQNSFETSLKNIVVVNHFFFGPGAYPIDDLQGGDLDLYYYPHLLLADGENVFNLSVQIQKVLPKILEYQQIASVWLGQPRLSLEGDLLIVRALLGQGLAVPNDYAKKFALEGELEVAVPVRNSGDQLRIEKSKPIRMNFQGLRNFSAKKTQVEVVKVDHPQSFNANQPYEFSATFKLPKGKEIEAASVELQFSLDIAPETIWPNFLIGDHKRIERISPEEVRVTFKGNGAQYQHSKEQGQIFIKRFRIDIAGEQDLSYAYPKLRPAIRVEGATPIKKMTLQDYAVYSSTVAFPDMDLKMHEEGVFFPRSFFKKGAINSTVLELYFSPMEGELFADVNLFVEELMDSEGTYLQKGYKLQDIVSDYKKTVTAETTNFQFTINADKFSPGAKGLRLLGVQLYSNKREGGTYLLRK